MKYLGFLLTFQIDDSQDIIYNTLDNDITVKVDKLVFFPILIADGQTQMLLNDSFKRVSPYRFIHGLQIEKLMTPHWNIKLI